MSSPSRSLRYPLRASVSPLSISRWLGGERWSSAAVQSATVRMDLEDGLDERGAEGGVCDEGAGMR